MPSYLDLQDEIDQVDECLKFSKSRVHHWLNVIRIAIPINFISENEQEKTVKHNESFHVSETTDENTTTTKIEIEQLKPSKKEFDPNHFMDEERRKLLVVSNFR